jgi:hypothetical protein
MRKPVIIAFLFLLAWTAAALDLPSYDLSETSRATEANRTVMTLQDAEGRSFTMSYAAEPSKAIMDRVVQLKDLFYGWKNITISSLRLTVTGSLIEAAVFPETVMVAENDLVEYVPAGLLFISTSTLEYDFRVTKDNLFLKVHGPYAGEDEMENKIASAVANPSLFLLSSDPTYLLGRIEAAEGKIALLQETLDNVGRTAQGLLEADQTFVLSDQNLSETDLANLQGDQALSDELKAIEDEVKAGQEDLKAQQAELKAQQEQIKAQQSALDAKSAELASRGAELETLRYAAMTNENQDWFTKKLLPKDGVARVLELKRGSPALTAAEMAKQLQSEGIKMSDQEIKIVLRYFFGEF